MDFFTGVFPTILEYSVAPIKKHISYAFNFRSKVNKLGGEVKKLAVEKESLEHSVEEKMRQGEKIMNNVGDWQVQTGKAIDEAKELIDLGEEEAQKSCSSRFCLNLKKCYDIGKKAEEKTSGIIQLQEERGKFGSISYRPPLQQIVKPPVEGYEAESRKKILKEVMDALMDSNVNMVGVYGMGGIGKTTLAKEVQTTLAKEVHGQAKRDNLFDAVILATVTATPELRRIQGVIAEMLGLKFDEETEDGRASRLYQCLNERRTLIILDDLWNMLELEKVGIPIRNDTKGCKVLLTSRSLDVLSEMGSQNNFKVEGLLKEEARKLFEIKVADVKDKKIAEEILVKCAGFPLLIVTVAGLLKNKELHVWEDTLTQLSMFDNQKIQEKVYSVLEWSYKNLPGDDIKLIFLLCAICGQSDSTILDLLKYSLGLGLFKRYTVVKARKHFYKLMDDLKSSSLLLEISDNGLVKMHDTVRDAAILIAGRDQRVFRVSDAGDQLRAWPSRDDLKNCNKISLPYSDIKELPEDLGCPEAEFLLFFSKGRSLDISDSAFQGIKLLKVLCFSGMRFSPVPRSFCFLTNLHTLCLDDCQLVDIAIIGQLKKLEILSFRGSMLELLPSEIGQLTQLKLLDLSDCSKLIIPTNVISKLSSLEELLMRNSFNNWELEEHSNSRNASLSELESLSHLSSLEVHVPNAKALPRNLFSKHLERYQILIGDGWDWAEDYKKSKILKLKFNTNIDLLDRVTILLKETETLYLDLMNRTRNVLPSLEIGGFPNLKELDVSNSFELQHIVDCTKRVTTGFSLESLHLNQLTSLVKIWHGMATSYQQSFSKLRELSVNNCNKLKNIFELSMVRSLSQLETMKVSHCNGMEGIVVYEGDCGFDGNEAVEFSRLRILELYNLPQLKGFVYKKKSSPTSEIATSGYSETTSGYGLGTPPPLFDKMVAFPNLEELHVSSIHSIGTIFPSGILERFQKLKMLEVWDCKLLEEIYQSQDLNIEKPNETLTFELTTLDLDTLPKLMNVWSSVSFFTFENLEEIYVDDCEALKNLFPPFIAKSLQKLETLWVCSCGVMEEIVAKEESVNNVPCFLFPQLTSLYLQDLMEIRSFYPGRHTLECPKLKRLYLRDSHKASMHISESSYGLQETRGEGQHHHGIIIPHHQQPFLSAEKVFPNLEELSMGSIFFKTILHSSSWIQYFTKLRSLTLSNFQGKLMTISQFGFFESMPNLQELVVEHCYLKELCRSRSVDGDKSNSTTSSQPYIKILMLNFVRSLKHVWRQDSRMDPLLPYLETLKLCYCWDLISLAPSSYASFQNLTILGIERCYKITNLMKPSTAKTMANLVKIVIKYCDALKEIVVVDDGQDGGDKTTNECIVFNKLKTLELCNLENLMGFCMSNCYSFQFSCLEEVSFSGCPNLRTFCHGVLDTPKLESINLKGRLNHFQANWWWEGDLNVTIKQLYEEKIGLQQLESLRLSRILQLKERWHGQLPFEFFRTLRKLAVDKCALFFSAIPSNLLPFLNNLRELVVEQCDSVEEVFDLDGLNVIEGHIGLLSQLYTLELIELPKLRHVWNKDPLGILGIRNLRKLKLHRCASLRNIFTLSMVVGLVNLVSLEVRECALVEVIIKKEGEEEANWEYKTMFPSLESIELEHLPNLVNFYSGGHVLKCPSLRKVNVVSCPKMPVYGCSSSRSIIERHEERPPKESVNYMPTLRFFNGEIEISSLEELVVEWNSAVNEIWHAIFPAPFLRTLGVIQLVGFPAEQALLPSEFLHSLPNLKKFVVGDSFSERIFPKEVNTVKEIQPAGSFAQLKELKLYNLPNLKHLVEEDSQLTSLFQLLEEFEVTKCSGLVRLITSSRARGLVNLQKMVVKECERMTEIVASEANEVETDGGFHQLNYLELYGLPCLTSFSSNCTFDFPRLEEVIIRECPKMMIFAKNGLSTPWLDEVQIGEDEDAWRWEGNLNNTIEKLFLEMNVQDVKEDELALSCT